jgi:hypothetical protein
MTIVQMHRAWILKAQQWARNWKPLAEDKMKRIHLISRFHSSKMHT